MVHIIYSDIDQTLINNYVYDIDDVKQSIMNIITTPKGSMPFNADYGCNIEDYLHDINIGNAVALYTEITNAIKINDPRAVINNSKSNVKSQGYLYQVNLWCNVKGLSDSQFQIVLGLAP